MIWPKVWRKKTKPPVASPRLTKLLQNALVQANALPTTEEMVIHSLYLHSNYPWESQLNKMTTEEQQVAMEAVAIVGEYLQSLCDGDCCNGDEDEQVKEGRS